MNTKAIYISIVFLIFHLSLRAQVVEFGAVNFTEDEGVSVAIDINITSGSGPVDVIVTTMDGSAIAPVDYTAISNTITISSSETINILIANDSQIESNETFTVELAISPGSNGTIGTNNQATVNINDITPQIEFTSSSISAGEGTDAMLNIAITSGMGPVDLDISTMDGSATAPTDYTAITNTITINLNTIISIPIITDGIPESNETFTVHLAVNSGSYGVITNGVATVTILDNTPPPSVVEFSPSSVMVNSNEGTSATMDIVLTSGNGPVNVDVNTIDVSATANNDYTPLSTTLTIHPSQVITIDIVADGIVEGNETFEVHLAVSPGSNGSIGTNGIATVTINDYIPPVVEFSAASTTMNTSEGSTLSLDVILASGTGPVLVDYTTMDGSAMSPDDYTLSSGTITVDGSGANINIPIANDAFVEPNEIFTVELTQNANSNATVGNNNISTVTINDMQQSAPVDPLFIVESNNGSTYNGFIVQKNGNTHVNGILEVDYSYKLPTNDGLPGQVLTTNGSGTTSWEEVNVSSNIDYYNIPFTEFIASSTALVQKSFNIIPPYSNVFATIVSPDQLGYNALTAPIRLKNGTKILEVVFDYIDNDNVENLTLAIASQNLSTGNISILGSANTLSPSIALQSISISGSSLSSDTINNSEFAYFVYCVSANDPMSWSPYTLGIASVSIKYQN